MHINWAYLLIIVNFYFDYLSPCVHSAYMSAKVKRFLKQIRGLFPSPLPQGVSEFNAWIADIKATYDLPTDRDDDIIACFSAVIMRFDQIACSKPKYYFVRALRSGAAKQVASYTFTEMKHKQNAAMLAEQKKQAEATSVDNAAQG